jgi:hypothetical protein
MFTYARDHLGLKVKPGRRGDPPFKKSWISPSFHNCIRKALPEADEREVSRLVHQLDTSFDRALKSLHRKGLIVYETGHHGFGDINRFGFFAWYSGFVVTPEGARVARAILRTEDLSCGADSSTTCSDQSPLDVMHDEKKTAQAPIESLSL